MWVYLITHVIDAPNPHIQAVACEHDLVGLQEDSILNLIMSKSIVR